jgi:hypothetical protein
MFAEGVVEEVRALRDLGSTAEKALGREIRACSRGNFETNASQKSSRDAALRQKTVDLVSTPG